MKHRFLKHTLTLALALVLIGSLVPMAALAAGSNANVWQGIYFDRDPLFGSLHLPVNHKNIPIGDKKVTIGENTFGHFYDFGGFVFEYSGVGLASEDLGKRVVDGKEILEIPVKPTKAEDAAAWEAKYGSILVGYTLHHHDVAHAPLFADNNLHWRVCPDCQRYIGMNWHHDVDNDGICDECHRPIFYRYVTVKDAPGGKVEISKEKCMLADRVSVTVTPDPGYKLQEIHGINDNEMMSVRPCYEDVKGSQYHMIVDVWDVDIYPTFVKE